MRTITINEQSFDVRGLKRKEVKTLRNEGLSLTSLDPETSEQAMERVFEMIFSPDQINQIDELQNVDALKLWTAALSETYGSPGEEKNS